MERFSEDQNESKSGKPIDFVEPHEWLAKLSSSDEQRNAKYTTNQQTPRMTPKKTVHLNTTHGKRQDYENSLLPRLSNDKTETTIDNGQMQKANSLQLNAESAENDIVASVVVDVDEEGIGMTDGDRNELAGMMVSLSVELESVEDNALASDDTNVSTSHARTSACHQKRKTSVIHWIHKKLYFYYFIPDKWGGNLIGQLHLFAH